MKLFSSVAAAVAAGSLIAAVPAKASTIVITTSWIMNHEKEKCIKNAVKAANKSGFSESHEIITDKSRPITSLYAYTKAGPYAMSVECNEDNGTAALAVSGIMAEKTHERFEDVIRAWE